MYRFRLIPAASLFCLGQFFGAAQAGIVLAPSQAEFVSALEPGHYRETFDGLLPNVAYGDSMAFSQGSFGFEVQADGHGSNLGIYPFENQESYGDIWLSTNYDGTTIDIRNIQGDANAIGGEFFISAFEANVTNGLVTVFAEGIDGQSTLQSPLSAARNFFGFYATEGMTFSRLTISLPSAFNYATLNDLIIARRLGGDPLTITAVPEPSAIALMAIGTVIAGYLRRRCDPAV